MMTWSYAAFLHSAVQGMLGLRVNGLTRQIAFSPHLPADWSTLTVGNIQLAESSISFHWRRTSGGAELEVVNSGRRFHLHYCPEIPLGAHLTHSRWNGRSVRIRLEEHVQDSHAAVDLDVRVGISRLVMGYTGGVSLVVPQQHPLIGNASRAMKIVGVGLHADTFVLDTQVNPLQNASFDLETGRKIMSVQGATWKAIAPDRYAITIEPSAAKDQPSGYRQAKTSIRFAPMR
jgi:hypothetical protein